MTRGRYARHELDSMDREFERRNAALHEALPRAAALAEVLRPLGGRPGDYGSLAGQALRAACDHIDMGRDLDVATACDLAQVALYVVEAGLDTPRQNA